MLIKIISSTVRDIAHTCDDPAVGRLMQRLRQLFPTVPVRPARSLVTEITMDFFEVTILAALSALVLTYSLMFAWLFMSAAKHNRPIGALAVAGVAFLSYATYGGRILVPISRAAWRKMKSNLAESTSIQKILAAGQSLAFITSFSVAWVFV
jgi:hypothetical protein